jgi:ABC-type multidrug transport system ATPase subunit
MLVALGIASAVVFGGNGMHPVDLVRVVRETASFRVALWAGWLVLVMPVARVLLTHPAAELPSHLTTSGLVALVAALRGVPRPEASLIARLGVATFLDKPLPALSLGQRRRASLLAALIGDPKLLVLDEPTNGLDEEGAAMLRDLLAERTRRGHATLAATHDQAFVEATRAQILSI